MMPNNIGVHFFNQQQNDDNSSVNINTRTKEISPYVNSDEIDVKLREYAIAYKERKGK
jgi:hypothetical protein